MGVVSVVVVTVKTEIGEKANCSVRKLILACAFDTLFYMKKKLLHSSLTLTSTANQINYYKRIIFE